MTRRTTRLLAIGAGIALAGLTACSGGSDGKPVDLRWIRESPSDELLIDQLTDVTCGYEARFSGRKLPDGVELLPGSAILDSSAASGTTLRGGSEPPAFVFSRAFAAADIDAVRAVVTGVRSSVRLSWRPAGGGEPLGNIELRHELGSGTRRDHYLFDLRGKLPLDRPVELRFEPATVAGQVVTIESFCAGKAALSGSRIDLAAKVPWKATLAEDMRDALLVPTSGKLAWEGELPPAAHLMLGLGAMGAVPGGLEIRVDATAGGGVARRVLSRSVAPEALAAGWTDLELAIGNERRGPHRLEISVAAADGRAVAALVSVPRIQLAKRPSGRPNIVLISLDTLRADHLSLYGYERPTTPRLDAWLRGRNAAVFRQVVPPSGWTLPSHFSLFTGLDAHRHLANYSRVAIDTSGYVLLATLLRNAGYRTQAYTGGGFLHPIYGMARGFDSFVPWSRIGQLDDELETHLERASAFLDGAREDPFLLFFHTYEIHTPNSPRQPFFGRMSRLPADWTVDVEADKTLPENGFLGRLHPVMRLRPEEPTRPVPKELESLPRDVYDSAIAFTDEKLAPFLARLSSPPFARDTIIVITSDHGESLGEGGLWGHGNLSVENLRVPLVLILPGGGTIRTIPSQVRLLDLFPTLLEVAGVPVPADSDGRSLLALARGASEPGRPAIAYGSSTNHGLSYLSPDGLKIDWRNSVWKPIAGDIQAFRTTEFTEEPIPPGSAPAELTSLQRALEARYARESAGLRLDLVNRGAVAVEVAIDSDLIDPTSVKSPSIAGARLDWRYIGHLEGKIESGAKLSLQLERALRREVELAIEVRREGCEGVVSERIASTVELLRQGESRLLALPSCGGDRPVAAGVLEVQLRWRGPAAGAARPGLDRKLEEDLAALGYLH